MSGPIVRKYGFPNFDKIFGARPLQHGAEEETPPGDAPAPAPSAEPDPSKPAFDSKPSPPTQFGAAVE